MPRAAAETRIALPNDFVPRGYQVPPMRYLDNGGKRAMAVWHRRGGKDLVFGHQTVKMAHERIGPYWHVFPTYEQGRKAVWEGFRKDGKRIMENIFPGFLDPKRPGSVVARKNEQQMMLELHCGSIWRLIGSDRVEVVGAGPVGVVFSEFALCKPSGWDFIRPMLAENDGWAAFITTPRGNNHAKKLYDALRLVPDAFTDLKTLFDTRAYDPEKTIAEARASGMPEALIRQEYLCDWTAALVGSVWGDLIEQIEKAGALAPFEHERDGVFTTWDLGISDSTAIWFWRVNGQGVDLIDFYDNHGKPMSHYFDLLDEKGRELGFKYAKHWVPHDAAARSLQTGGTIVEQFQHRYGNGAVAIGPQVSLLDGIQAARWLLQLGVRMHPRCATGVDALKQYHYEYDEDRKTFGGKPEHDWSSHAADAFRYLALVIRHSELMTRKPPEPKPLEKKHYPFSLDDLFTERERSRR